MPFGQLLEQIPDEAIEFACDAIHFEPLMIEVRYSPVRGHEER